MNYVYIIVSMLHLTMSYLSFHSVSVGMDLLLKAVKNAVSRQAPGRVINSRSEPSGFP